MHVFPRPSNWEGYIVFAPGGGGSLYAKGCHLQLGLMAWTNNEKVESSKITKAMHFFRLFPHTRLRERGWGRAHTLWCSMYISILWTMAKESSFRETEMRVEARKTRDIWMYILEESYVFFTVVLIALPPLIPRMSSFLTSLQGIYFLSVPVAWQSEVGIDACK